MKITRRLGTILVARPWLAYLFALFGGLVYAVQAWHYAHYQTSFVDEGAFLYIGYRFLSGTGVLYKNLGMWNYYAPLSFLIPGLVQKILIPGLLTARYFSIAVSLLMLVGLWLGARHLGGNWWAAAAIWALALTPIQIKIYTLGMSQILAACLLTWALACVLGGKRPSWQIMVGSLLTGLTVMTRHNLILVVPLTVGYIFWQYGRKAGWRSIIASLLPILTATVIFWPGIIRLWSFYWLPEQWFPFLNQFGPPVGTVSVLNFDAGMNWSTSMAAFFMSFRVHYFSLVGVCACLLLWPQKWEDKERMRSGIFLSVLFISLFLLHAWVTLGANQCPFCISPYTAFFSNTAILLVIVSFSSWKQKLSRPRQALIVVFLLFLSLALGQATFDRLGDWILAIPVPRISNGLHWGEWVTLWAYIGNKIKLDYFVARVVLPPFFGLFSGLLLIFLSRVVYRFLLQRKSIVRSFGSFVLITFLMGGCILSPLMNGDYRQDGDCSRDVIANYQQIGEKLADIIPAGSNIYWNVGSAVPLLYTKQMDIHLAQIYGVYTYRIGGVARDVEESGYWNEELAKLWMLDADFLVIEQGSLIDTPSPENYIDLDSYTLKVLPPVNPCRDDTLLYIYQRSP